MCSVYCMRCNGPREAERARGTAPGGVRARARARVVRAARRAVAVLVLPVSTTLRLPLPLIGARPPVTRDHSDRSGTTDHALSQNVIQK